MNVKTLQQLRQVTEMFPPSVYYKFLFELAREKMSKLSVVLGVCGGGCCYNLLLANPLGKVVGIDLANDHKVNTNYLKTFPNFTFMQKDSITAANFFDDNSVDVLFIDTVHTYEQTMSEFNAWRSKLTTDAVVCLDDLFRGGMQKAWDELPGDKLRMDTLHIGGSKTDGGFGVLFNIPEVR